jgi:hypothetical protein
MDITDIQNRIQNAKRLDFGTLFNQSIELFKKTWVQGLVTLLLNLVLTLPVVMIVYIPLIFTGMMDMYANNYDSYPSYEQPELSIITFLVLFVLAIFMIVAVSTIGTGLKSAFYRICKIKDNEEMLNEDYFYFFKKSYLGKTIKVGLAMIGISFLAAFVYVFVLIFFMFSSDFESTINIPLLFLTLLPLIYVTIPITYMAVVYAFNPEKSITDIIKLSFALGNKKWLLTFGLVIIASILAGIVGFLMCFVGIYVTTSFSYLPPYFIYKEVIGFENENDNLQIEESTRF